MAVQTEAPQGSGKKRFSLPSAYTILFILIVLATLATWFVPAGTYDLDKEGSPIPGTYKEIDSNPQRIVEDSLKAPINGLYGVENKKGNIDFYNTGTLFGAIDVALFIIVIGGFLGITMKSGAIQAGITRLVLKLKGRERWMIPLLMVVFAAGGTSYGMAEESLAFYALIITVMIAAGYDALTGASVVLLGCGIGTLGSTINPFATGIASGFADTSISEGLVSRLIILIGGLALGIFFVLRYADTREEGPFEVTRRGHEGGERGTFRGRRRKRGGGSSHPHGTSQVDSHSLRTCLLRDDVRRDPLEGSRGRAAHSVVVVPRDDRLVHPVLDPDRFGRKDA